MSVDVYVHLCVSRCMCACMCACMCVRVCARVRARVCVQCMCACMCAVHVRVYVCRGATRAFTITLHAPVLGMLGHLEWCPLVCNVPLKALQPGRQPGRSLVRHASGPKDFGAREESGVTGFWTSLGVTLKTQGGA